MLDQLVVGGRQLPAADPRVRDDQPIERIAGPSETAGGDEPFRGRWFVELPALVDQQRVRRPVIVEADSASFEQELNFEQRGCSELGPVRYSAASRLAHAVFSTFNRAKYLSLPSTSVHGASRVLVRSTISLTARS